MRARLATLVLLLTFCGCQVFIGRISTSGTASRAAAAEAFLEDGEYDEAIQAYKEHFEWRRSDASRPDEENPYFYYVLIGDIYLQTERPAEAFDAFQLAQDNGIADDILADRFRRHAQWYEKRQQFDKAIELLQAKRELDPLLFDSDIDRIHKESVRREQEGS